MALIWSCYRYKGKTENRLAREASYTSGHRSRYRAIYPSASYSRRKGKVVCSVVVYKRRGLN